MSHKVTFTATREVESLDEIADLSPQGIVDDLHAYSGSYDLKVAVVNVEEQETALRKMLDIALYPRRRNAQ